MISVYLECETDERDTLIAELYDRGTVGLLESGSGLRAWFEDGAELEDLIERYDGEALAGDEEDWVARTRESFPAFEIGERFWLAPPWNLDDAPAGRLRLEINPGLACGTGWHQCTQMCLAALERYVRKGDAVLDVGTGSGILSAAADLLGAGVVIGCDVDADAVRIARDRIGSRVFTGSVEAARSEAFDIAVANISAGAVMALLPDLRRVCRPAGVLILSGFGEMAPVQGAIETMERNGWQCIVARA